jgi:hypothetical protein
MTVSAEAASNASFATLIVVIHAVAHMQHHLVPARTSRTQKRVLQRSIREASRHSPFDPECAPSAALTSERTLDSCGDLGSIVTPINVDVFGSWLDGYPEQHYIINGFTQGFRVMFSSAPFSAVHGNHPSARDLPDTLAALVEKERLADRIAGPFDSPPLDQFVVSPLGLVPKEEPNTFRLIHDLSFPRDGLSVNQGIDPIDAAVSYETFDVVILLVQTMGQGALIAKSDIEHAFRIIPIHPADRYLFGFACMGKFYFDKCLPMGCRSSCSIFERFSTALQWVAVHKLGIPAVTHILDDFIFIGPASSSITEKALDRFLDFCAMSGIPIKCSKTVRPTTCVSVHGIEVDTISMEARLPEEKLAKARDLLASLSK